MRAYDAVAALVDEDRFLARLRRLSMLSPEAKRKKLMAMDRSAKEMEKRHQQDNRDIERVSLIMAELKKDEVWD